MTDDITGTTLAAVVALCNESPLSTTERLHVLSMAWLMCASEERNEAMIEPGGFQAVQAKQLVLLQRLRDLVASDEPDLELERMFHEGNTEGMLAYLQEKMRRLDAE